uniref:Mediator of DNA damage checkpoint protein 1-like n=1 Tax=Hippocampus comes TaxID=109280 RepID=A0A3Q3EBV3_HIPCM
GHVVGFTYPGTLWCGAGNMADHYDQLGEYEETDRCCRTHDHCPHVIHAFSSKYGHTNFKWHSISHCDCDEALKGCLRRANDTSSRVVGQAFFNVIGAPCFQLVYEERLSAPLMTCPPHAALTWPALFFFFFCSRRPQVQTIREAAHRGGEGGGPVRLRRHCRH